MGDARPAETVRPGLIGLDGPPSLVRAFPTWLTLSAFAGGARVGAAVAVRPAWRPTRAVIVGSLAGTGSVSGGVKHHAPIARARSV
jgi:hypothetical protein